MPALIGPLSLRALRFVDTLRSQDVMPAIEDVHAFVEARTNTADFDPYLEEIRIPTVEYLLDARLLEDRGGRAALTDAGRALLRSADTEARTVEVVGRLTDPFTYSEVLARIDSIPGSLVVDPYLPPADLTALLRLPSVERVLVRHARNPQMQAADRMRHLGIALGARPDVELRFVDGKQVELHDRLVIPRAPGEALMLGTSLGGTQVTVLTHVSRDTAALLRAHYEQVWKSSTPIDPVTRGATA